MIIKKYIYIALFLLLQLPCKAQDTCYKATMNYLFCKSKNQCSLNADSTYHLQLIEQFTELISIYNPTNKDAYNQLGKEYYALANYDSALYYYNIASKYKDTFGVALNNIGTIYYSQGYYKKAFNYFVKANKKDPKCKDYINNIASYYGSTAQYQQCITWFKKTLEIKDKDNYGTSMALKGLMITYEKLGNDNLYEVYREKLENHELESETEVNTLDCICIKPACYSLKN